MVQIVFVHGVSVRKSPNSEGYNDDVAERRAHFARYCFKDAAHMFRDPYWGDFAAKPDLGGLYLKMSGKNTLGGLGRQIQENAIEPANNEKRLLEAAKDDFASVLNTLAIILADETEEPTDINLAESIADYLITKENSDGKIIPPDWLSDPRVSSDKAFIERLKEEIGPADEVSLGLGDKLKRAAGQVLGAGL